MKILFVVPRFNLTNQIDYNYLFPVGLGYILAVLKKAKYDADCINLNHIHGNVEDIVKKTLDSKTYDFVLTGNTSLGYTITKIILKTAARHPSHPKTILGGLIITLEPEMIFKALNPDFGVVGDGEEVIIELLDSMHRNKDLKKIKGLIYRENENIVFTGKREALKDINSIPFPDFESMGFEEFLDNLHPNFFGYFYMNIFDYPRPYPILGSRSCPFHCTFCYHPDKYQQRSIENIMEELRLNIKKYDINMIFMYDDCFSIDIKRVFDFCAEMKKIQAEFGRQIKWATSMTVKSVTPELLKTMKDAGCYAVSFGFESYNQKVLNSMRKPITPAEIDKARKYATDAGLVISANFIFGDVAETKETANETLDYWVKNCEGQFGIGFIKPFPGTEIYKQCIKKGLIKDELDFIENTIELQSLIGTNFNMTESMTDSELKEFEKKVYRSISKCFRFVTPAKMVKTDKSIYYVDILCPFCNKRINYGNLLINNKRFFGFLSTCRECSKVFYVVSPLRKLAYKHSYLSNKINDRIKKIRNILGRKKVSKNS